jgi:hypothetical protein
MIPLRGNIQVKIMMQNNQTDSNRIRGIISFMKYCTTLIDPETILEKQGIDNIENFTESQLTYCLEKGGVESSNIKQLFRELNNLTTSDIRLINSEVAIFEFFILIAGGLYYAKSIRRLIKKDDILKIKDTFPANAYDFIYNFAKDPESIEGYPVFNDFKNHFISMGYRILYIYLGMMPPNIVNPLLGKINLSKPVIDSKNLRISNEYALKLATQARDFIINQSE